MKRLISYATTFALLTACRSVPVGRCASEVTPESDRVGHFPVRASGEHYEWDGCCVDPVEVDGRTSLIPVEQNKTRGRSAGWIPAHTDYGLLQLDSDGMEGIQLFDISRVPHRVVELGFAPVAGCLSGRGSTAWVVEQVGVLSSRLHRLTWARQKWTSTGSVELNWIPSFLVHVDDSTALVAGAVVARCAVDRGCETLVSSPDVEPAGLVPTGAVLDSHGDLWVGYCSAEPTAVRVPLPWRR